MTGFLFEIADKSTEQLLTWREAVKYVELLGEGWRLPTLAELKQIHESDNDFAEKQYWSSNEFGTYDAEQLDFKYGWTCLLGKNFKGYVRAVKDNV